MCYYPITIVIPITSGVCPGHGLIMNTMSVNAAGGVIQIVSPKPNQLFTMQWTIVKTLIMYAIQMKNN